MSKNYKQCMLMRDATLKIVWIPEKFAKLNKVLKIDNEDSWIVCEVYDTASEETVKGRSDDYKRWRKGRGLDV